MLLFLQIIYGNLAKYFFDVLLRQLQKFKFRGLLDDGTSWTENVLLGFTHLIIQDYSIKIITFFCIEFTFFLLVIYILSINNVFEYKTKAWINLSAAFIRLIIISIFYF